MILTINSDCIFIESKDVQNSYIKIDWVKEKAIKEIGQVPINKTD